MTSLEIESIKYTRLPKNVLNVLKYQYQPLLRSDRLVPNTGYIAKQMRD
jgi:hypothetical protein